MTVPRALPDDFPHDPLRTYRELREQGPIHHVVLPNGIPGWLVVDHGLARRALADPALSKDAADATALNRRLAAEHGADGGFGADLPRHMLNADPPDHDRLRRLVNRAFTPRAVQRMRPRIEALTAELLDGMAERGGDAVDLLDAFAFPLPIAVICELLGVPEADRGDFRSWTTVVATSTGPDSAEIVAAYESIMGYLAGLVEHRRRHPGGTGWSTP